MRGYLVRRVLATIPVLFIVGTIVFFILHLTPGDPAVLLLSGSESSQLAKQDLEEIRRHLGLDRPLYEQYAKFLWHTVQGDLGTSIFTGQTVTNMFGQRVEATASIGIVSQLLALMISIPLGVIAAYKANTLVDRGIMLWMVMGFSVPQYWLAYNLIFVFAVGLGWFPAVGFVPIGEGIIPWARHIALPVATLVLTVGALTARITRSSMLETLREDYIRTARAKGLANHVVLVRHALRNASIPVLTVVGLSLSSIVTGIIVLEVVFAIPGMGRGLVDAIIKRDYPSIQGLILITAFTFVMINLFTDLLYAYLDPRIRYE